MNKQFTRFSIVAIFLISILSGAAVSADPATGSAVLSHLTGSIPAAQGHMVWNFTTGDWISSSPAVAGGTVYIGSEDGNIYAVNAGSGALVWKYRTGNYVSSSPAIADGIVYTGAGDGNLYALSADSGSLLWSYRTGAGISASPAITDGMVFAGSEDGTVSALNEQSGALLWNYSTGNYLHSSPTVSGGKVFFGSYDHNVYALNATTGSRAWNFTTGNTVLSSPAIAGNVVYIGSSDHTVYALDEDSGTEKWGFSTGGPVLSSPAVSGKIVYIGSSDGNLYALDAGTGAVTWMHKTGDSVATTPRVDDGIVYVGSGDGNLYALNATTGLPVWQFSGGHYAYTTPAIADKVIYAGSYDHNLYAISNLPPVAGFNADVTSGTTPLPVHFTDTSAGSPTSWLWDFGDGTSSTLQNPVHTYFAAGSFTVNLTASNGGGSDNRIQTGYVNTTTILPPPPVANFTISRTTGTTPFTVQFADTSDGVPTAWLWDFGDGNTSTRENPVYTYVSAGNFTVTMTASNPGGNSTRTSGTPIVLRRQIIEPSPDFSVNATSGVAPLAVQFTDASTGPGISTWAWDFNNDGIIDSTDQNPICVYKKPGAYTVNLTVTNEFGTRTISKTGLITVGSMAPAAGFTADNTTGSPPLTVQFNDTSTGQNITGWAWDFNNDGIIDSTDQNPICIYKLPGSYTVNLTVTNPYGSNTFSQVDFVTVGSMAPVASFTADTITGIPPLAVQFNDTSTGQNITGWAWDFNGDGITDSTDKNPICVYKKPGNYTVSLTSTSPFGSNTSTRIGFVTVTNGVTPDFTADNISGTAPLTVRFSDNSSGQNITGWAWDFNGDGIIDSTDKNPVCVYNTPGDYTVNLTVTNSLGSSTGSKTAYIHVGALAPVASFTADNITGITPLTAQFSDTSTGANITGWAWDFNGDGSIDSTDKNPVCVYNKPGTYTVNLTVTNAYGANTTSRTGYITVSNGIPIARFALNSTSGYAPLTVQFRDISAGANITGWAWDFNGDGIVDSTEQNPSCVYNLPGTYTITFTATNAYGSNTIVRKGFVTVK